MEEIIICPQCGAVQAARVVWEKDDPWPQYVHICSVCGYLITESEWVTAHNPATDAADSAAAGGRRPCKG